MVNIKADRQGRMIHGTPFQMQSALMILNRPQMGKKKGRMRLTTCVMDKDL